jgi:hypothetical protein
VEDQQRTRAPQQDSPPPLLSPVPQWLHGGDGSPQPEVALEGWRRLAYSDPAGTVHFFPEGVLTPRREPRDPLVYARWQRRDAATELASLAVLDRCELSSLGLPALPLKMRLKGRKVVESALLGQCDEAATSEFLEAMAQLLARGEADYILFRDLDAEAPIRRLIGAAAARRRFYAFEPSAPAPHWWIRFPAKPADYWSQFSKKTRYNFRYRAKHLEHSVRSFSTPEQVPEFVARVQSLVTQTWQHRRLEAAFDAEERTALWMSLAKAGAFRSYIIEQGERVLAFGVGMQWNGVYVYDETGYDPADAAKSPGQVLLYRVIEDLIARDTPQVLDFGFGDSEYKKMFSNHETRSGPVALVRRSVAPMTAMLMLRARSGAARFARQALGKTGLLSPLRHFYRGHRSAGAKSEGTDAAKSGGANVSQQDEE